MGLDAALTRRGRLGAAACGLALLLTGCASADTPRTSSGAPSTRAPSVSPPAARDEGSTGRAVAPVCRAGDEVAVGRSALDAALGRRYVRIDVRNCTSHPVRLERPVVTGVTGTGRAATLRVVLTPVADRPDTASTLARGQHASAGFAWQAEPRSGRLQEVRVAVTRNATRRPVPLRLSELRPTTRLDYYPWVRQPKDVFS